MSRGSQTSARFSSMSRQDTAMSLLDASPDESALTRYLRANNKHSIAACLDQVKSDPKRCKEFIKQTNCLNILVQLLRCENHQIVDRSLSILADACMTSDAREKVRNSKIASNVVLIIEHLDWNAMLHCRACRLISNLSECSWHAEELCNAGVIKALMALLMSNTTDILTNCMAVRAVRNIWNVYKNIRETIIQLEIIQLIARLFVNAEEKSNGDAKYSKLIEACLKAMCTFLNTLDPRCGNQMHVNKDMWGYKRLMRCCVASNNKLAVKCFYTLCQIAECRLNLGISGTVEELITLINVADTNSNHLCKEMLLSLCLFCRESVNRDRIRLADGLQVILTLLNKPEHEHHHLRLLEALSLFIYDEIGFSILTKHGMLEILIAKLTNAIAKNNEKSNTLRKRPSDYLTEHCCKRSCKYPTSRYSMDYRDDWSPRSATSASSSSPSTPPLPPYSDFNAEIGDFEDDVYSPVYSDKECDNNEEEETTSPKSYKSLTTVEADSDSSSLNSETPLETYTCEYYTLILLNKLSLSIEPIYNLADPITIKSLTNYIRYTKSSVKQNRLKKTVVLILSRIIRNMTYFMPLIKQGFAFEVQALEETEECVRGLCAVAETGGAIGQLSFTLLRGEEEHKLMIAVSIPLLIKTHRTLKCLLEKYGGLQLIFRLLADPSHKLHKRAIWSICQLGKALTIYLDDNLIDGTMPEIGELYSNPRLPFGEMKLPISPTSSIVTFELDDGTTIKACKQMLCQCSPVFSVMLKGNFIESNQKQIRLRDTSRDGLKTLILAASGAASIMYAFENRSIESLLDAVLLADYFLMPDMVETLTKNSLNKLNHENFYRAWCWAKNRSCPEFRSYCIKSFLTANMSWIETMRTFCDFYASDVFDEFLCEIKDIITDVLCQC